MEDALGRIMLHMPYPQFLDMASVSRRASEVLQDDNFWQEKSLLDYPYNSKLSRTWKEHYLALINHLYPVRIWYQGQILKQEYLGQLHKPFDTERYGYEMVLDDPFLQYNFQVGVIVITLGPNIIDAIKVNNYKVRSLLRPDPNSIVAISDIYYLTYQDLAPYGAEPDLTLPNNLIELFSYTKRRQEQEQTLLKAVQTYLVIR